MSKRGWLAVLGLMACGDDAPSDGTQLGALSCAKLSVAECGQHPSCQLIHEDAGAPHCGEERIGVRSCAVMTVDECRLDARCETIEGRPFDTARQCIDAAEPVGCQDRGRGCPAAVLYASASGEAYEFARGCTPAGWQSVQPVVIPQPTWVSCTQGDAKAQQDAGVFAGDAQVAPGCMGASCATAWCGEHDVASCKLDVRCRVLKGRTFGALKCQGDEVELGCTEVDSVCDPHPAFVTDAKGNNYFFSESGSGCVPSGFYWDSKVDTGYPLCDAPINDPCAGLTYKDCDQHPECRRDLGCPVITPPSKGPTDCEQRSVADCKVDTQCASMAGHPLDGDCNAQELVGCITLGRSCGLGIKFAKNAEGRLFELDSDCLPTGFTPAEVPQVGAGVCGVRYTTRCEALGVERCGEDPGCEPMIGDALDLNAHCIGAPVAFACAAKSEPRVEGWAIAADRRGERYRVNGYRFVPDLTIYTADAPYSADATAALLALPACSP